MNEMLFGASGRIDMTVETMQVVALVQIIYAQTSLGKRRSSVQSNATRTFLSRTVMSRLARVRAKLKECLAARTGRANEMNCEAIKPRDGCLECQAGDERSEIADILR
jgi:hypothetical protein